MKKLKEAIEAQGIEPCRDCPRQNACATGLACRVFSEWVNHRRIVADPYVWTMSKAHRPWSWEPTVAIYNRIFERVQPRMNAQA